MNTPLEGPILERATTRLREIINATTMTDNGASLYLQQVAQAGLVALDALPVRPEAQQLAETMAQQINDVHGPLQNVTCVDGELEDDLLEFLGAINRIQEIPALSDGTIIDPFAALDERIQELSARIVWRIVADEDSEIVSEEEAGDASSPLNLSSQATKDISPFMPDVADTIDLLGVVTVGDNDSDPLSQSVTADERLALRLQHEEFSRIKITATVLSEQLSNSCGSTMPTAPWPSNRHRGQTLDFEETHRRGMDFLDLFRREGDLRNLSTSVSLLRESLLLCPSNPWQRGTVVGELATALWTQYQQEGGDSDINEAITLFDEVLGLCPSGHPQRARVLNNLATTLLTRYNREGNLSDLAEAIEQYREAFNLDTPGHPHRATSLNNLSSALFTRYQREGSLSDLAEAIERSREALNLCPPGHPYRALSLNNLSSALWIRYDRDGRLSDLTEAVEQKREAVTLCPPGHPQRAPVLNNLSSALSTRYVQEGSLSDLVEAIGYYREALDLRPPGHPGRALSLSNLASALSTRYELEGNLSDQEEVIEHYREALNLSPLGHPDRALFLSSLSYVLLARYDRKGCLSDLAETIEHDREVLNLRPRGHPDRVVSLAALSRALLRTIGGTTGGPMIPGYQTSTDEIFELLREAANLPNCPPRNRLRAALQWITAPRGLAPGSMLDAYSTALNQQDIVLATNSTIENKHTQLTSSKELTRCKRLGVEAASYAVRRGDLALAVEFLERGRNLLFAQIGRYRVDLEDLRKVNADLADRFSYLSNLLDASSVSNQSTLKGRTVFEDPIERYRRVASDWNRTVDDIRAVEGFDHFLKSPNYAVLRATAAEGPVIIVIPGDDQSDALIISQERDTPHHIILPGARVTELEELHDALIRTVGDDDGYATEKDVERILRSLWDHVVGPIADALENELHVALHSRIWWCPTSIFSVLPLHAAGRYASKDTNQNLPDRYVSSYTPTLHALMRARHHFNVGQGEKMLIVAQSDAPGQSQLPNAQPEAELVKKLADPKIASTLYSSKEGTRTAVLDAMVDHSWLHLACHGSQDFANPFQSCFCLYDGKLTLHDIIRRGLPNAKFAFLAACHTATGDFDLADEGLHLAAGLQFAGFKGVVGTVWEVADDDGPMIAEAFYSALQLERPGEESMDCSRAAYALNKAVKHLRDNGVPISRWMRFIHIGI